MSQSKQAVIGQLNYVELLPIPNEAVNMVMVKLDSGKHALIYDPDDAIDDIGTTRTFQGEKSKPKATSTVSSPGTGARGFMIGRLWHQWYVGLRPEPARTTTTRAVKNLLG